MGKQDRSRKANERLGSAVGGRVPAGHAVPFLCECSDEDCMDTVSLSLAVYREIRLQGNRYIVVNGHQAARDERIVGEGGGYSVVESVDDE